VPSVVVSSLPLHTSYSYSGEGFSLLQFTIEQGARTKGLGLDVKELIDAIFVRLAMTRTSLQWAP
jgi:hypothetical protein